MTVLYSPDARSSSLEAPAFSGRVRARLDRADLLCRRRGQRLTETRRQVLGFILSADRPCGAYDLLGKLRRTHGSAAPPTVYRALDFLMEQGLIHRIECLSAFVACSHAIDCTDACDHHAEDGVHRAQFLICLECGQAYELEDLASTRALLDAARGSGFRPEAATVEIKGICAACQRKQDAAARVTP